MNRLIRLELHRAFHGRLLCASLIVGIVLAVISAINDIASFNAAFYDATARINVNYYNQFAQNAFMYWMPLSVMESLPNLFFFLAPLLAGMAYSWSLRSDVVNGYAQSVMSRCPRAHYYLAKSIAAFIVGGTVVAVPLAVNFALLVCFVPCYTPDICDVVYTGIWTKVFLSGLVYTNPWLYVIVRLLVDFLLCGLWATAVLAVSLLIRNRIAIVALPYIAVMVVKAVAERINVLCGGTGSSITILDHLKARGDKFYYTGWALAGDLAVLFALSLLVPLILRKRDVL